MLIYMYMDIDSYVNYTTIKIKFAGSSQSLLLHFLLIYCQFKHPVKDFRKKIIKELIHHDMIHTLTKKFKIV